MTFSDATLILIAGTPRLPAQDRRYASIELNRRRIMRERLAEARAEMEYVER